MPLGSVIKHTQRSRKDSLTQSSDEELGQYNAHFETYTQFMQCTCTHSKKKASCTCTCSIVLEVLLCGFILSCS